MVGEKHASMQRELLSTASTESNNIKTEINKERRERRKIGIQYDHNGFDAC